MRFLSILKTLIFILGVTIYVNFHLNLIEFKSQVATLDQFSIQAFDEPLSLEAFQQSDDNKAKEESIETKKASTPKLTKITAITNEVDFLTQSPLAEWDDPRQQDACEEASVLMAINWAMNNPALTKQEARNEILKMSYFQEENYGVYKDTSIQDTFDWIVKGYYKYQNAWLQTNVTVDDIIDELYRGHLVIIPTNGQALGNPNFVGDGPPTHMILITGYDPKKEKFITNDPGTRNGYNFVYKKKVIQQSIRDYGTGYHALNEDLPTSMIVIGR